MTQEAAQDIAMFLSIARHCQLALLPQSLRLLFHLYVTGLSCGIHYQSCLDESDASNSVSANCKIADTVKLWESQSISKASQTSCKQTLELVCLL